MGRGAHHADALEVGEAREPRRGVDAVHAEQLDATAVDERLHPIFLSCVTSGVDERLELGVGDLVAVDDDGAGGSRLDAPDEVHERGLARTRHPRHDNDALTALYRVLQVGPGLRAAQGTGRRIPRLPRRRGRSPQDGRGGSARRERRGECRLRQGERELRRGALRDEGHRGATGPQRAPAAAVPGTRIGQQRSFGGRPHAV